MVVFFPMETVFSSAIPSSKARPGFFKGGLTLFITCPTGPRNCHTPLSSPTRIVRDKELTVRVPLEREAVAVSTKNIIIIATHGGEDPERATIPFVMANAALATEMDVTVILQTTGIWLAVKDYASHVRAEAFPPLDQLMKDFREMDGK